MERWPGAMKLSTAAAYLDMKSSDAVEKLIRDKELSCFQLTERGDRLVAKEDLDALIYRRMKEKVKSQK